MVAPPEAETLLRAVRRVLDFSSMTPTNVVETARKALADIQPLAPAAPERCAPCREIPDRCYSLSTSTRPDSLPQACYRLIPEDLLRESRCWKEVLCNECGTAYVYRRGYEYLAGGSEDEETFTRLDVAPILDDIARFLKRSNPSYSQELYDLVSLLERAIQVTWG